MNEWPLIAPHLSLSLTCFRSLYAHAFVLSLLFPFPSLSTFCLVIFIRHLPLLNSAQLNPAVEHLVNLPLLLLFLPSLFLSAVMRHYISGGEHMSSPSQLLSLALKRCNHVLTLICLSLSLPACLPALQTGDCTLYYLYNRGHPSVVFVV